MSCNPLLDIYLSLLHHRIYLDFSTLAVLFLEFSIANFSCPRKGAEVKALFSPLSYRLFLKQTKESIFCFLLFLLLLLDFFLNWPLLPTDSLQWFGLYYLTCFVFTGPPFMTRSRFVTWQQTYFCFFQDSGSVLNADLGWLQNTFPQSCVEAGFLHPVSLSNTNLPLASG